MKAATVLTAHVTKKFVLRLPCEIHEKILLTARHNHRSMNAEIIHVIHTHLTQQSTLSIPAHSGLPHNNRPITHEQSFLSLFHTLPEQKQIAVIALLTGLNS